MANNTEWCNAKVTRQLVQEEQLQDTLHMRKGLLVSYNANVIKLVALSCLHANGCIYLATFTWLPSLTWLYHFSCFHLAVFTWVYHMRLN